MLEPAVLENNAASSASALASPSICRTISSKLWTACRANSFVKETITPNLKGVSVGPPVTLRERTCNGEPSATKLPASAAALSAGGLMIDLTPSKETRKPRRINSAPALCGGKADNRVVTAAVGKRPPN